MLMQNQIITTKWGTKNKQHYVSLGYQFNHIGDEFDVPVKDLYSGSSSKVAIICDYCGSVSYRAYGDYLKDKEIQLVKLDACRKCSNKKSFETLKMKYGTSNLSLIDGVIDKRKSTMLKRYGVESPLQDKDLLNKKNNTCIERYGVSSVLLCKEIANKKKATCLKKYGFESSASSPEVQEKMMNTCLKKYGYKYSSQSPEIKDKMYNTFLKRYGVKHPSEYKDFVIKAQKSIRETMYKNGTVPTSKPQYQLYEMCKEIYGDDNVILNKPLSTLSLDIEIKYNDCFIDVEYDGIYWHKDDQKDRRRDEVAKSYGYKILRIRSNHNLPTREQIINSVDCLVKGNRQFIKITL